MNGINLDKMLSATDNIHQIFDELDDLVMIESVIGTCFDEWCAEHGMTSEETCEEFENLVRCQKQIHEEMGSF